MFTFKKRTIAVIALAGLLALAMALSGCGAASNDGMSAAPGDYGENVGGMGGVPVEGDKIDGTVGEFERKVIRTVNMSCETQGFDEAVTVILDALNAHGGYVEASSSSGTVTKTAETAGSSRRVTYTLRVPAEHLDAFLNALRADEGIHILSQDISSNEVTSSYYDTKTRLETLQAEKNTLTTMLEGLTEYKDISAMLEVEQRLYDVIEEMESLQTRLNLYDSQVALSTVNLTLREVVVLTDVEEPTFGERISDAFTSGWTAFGEACQDMAVWLTGAMPTLLILVVLPGIALIVIFGVRKKKKRERAEKHE